MFSPLQALHFTGIGGIGMSALARLAAAGGLRVSGTDVKASRVTADLEAAGVCFAVGHAAAHVPADAEAVIVTSAAAPDNPEIVEARRRGVPVATRGELLAALMRRRRAAAVAGSHGKTTVTSLLAAMAIGSGADPVVAVGAYLPVLGGANAVLGAGPWFIAESDESDGSFLHIHPEIAVVTNIDREHLEHYGSFEAARAAFVQFANQTELSGTVLACVDDAEVRGVLPQIRRRVMTYGCTDTADFRIAGARAGAGGGVFTLDWKGRPLGEFRTPLLGMHNILNAAAALAAAAVMGLDIDKARGALAAFAGPSRRMERKGEARGVQVVDDYGHHPAEVRATLAALRLLAPRRLVVLFQPHRYSRTAALLEEFATAFADADVVRVLDIYAASEAPVPGLDGEAVARRMREAGHAGARAAGDVGSAVAAISEELRPGDLLVTLGAGDVTEAGPLVLARLREGDHHG